MTAAYTKLLLFLLSYLKCKKKTGEASYSRL